MSSTEYLNYEGGKFSKSKGIGVFGTDARETGIPADVWRFYVYYNRPETSDALFTWKDFQEKVNAELIGNLGNLVNRTLQFVSRFYGGTLPAGTPDEAFWGDVKKMEGEIAGLLEKVELRDAFRRMFALSSLGNKRFQDGQPWKGVKETPEATASLIWNLVYLVRDLAILASPYIPATSERIAGMLGIRTLSWPDLATQAGIEKIERPEILFARLEDPQIEELRLRFSGTQKERAAADAAVETARVPTPAEIAERFRQKVDLRAAKIVEIKRHPDAEKLYIETVDLGAEKRTIVSGLVPHYKEEELLGHTVVLVANLKPAMLRGVESQGMLLAAQEGKTVEVLFVDHAQPGRARRPEGGGRRSGARANRHRHILHHANRGGRLPRPGRRRGAGVCGQGRGDFPGLEGQGEVIGISVSPAALSDLDSSDELLQTGWWGSFKQSHGWSAHPFRVTVTEPAATTFGLLVLSRTLLRRFVIAYVPFGPTFDPVCGRGEFLSSLAGALRPHLPPATLFLRFDLPWEKAGKSRAEQDGTALKNPLMTSSRRAPLWWTSRKIRGKSCRE